jgi:hypothetical protein
MAMTAFEKKLFILWRLVEDDDRLIRQRPSPCGTFPDAVWFLRQPQSGPGILGATKWLERHGLIIESIAYASDKNDLRQYYQGELRHRVYAASPAGIAWYRERM